MTRYERLRNYLFELEKYRDKCFGEIRPQNKPKLNREITRLRIYLYGYDEEMETEKKEVHFGFAVDNRVNRAEIKNKKELGLVITMD